MMPVKRITIRAKDAWQYLEDYYLCLAEIPDVPASEFFKLAFWYMLKEQPYIDFLRKNIISSDPNLNEQQREIRVMEMIELMDTTLITTASLLKNQFEKEPELNTASLADFTGECWVGPDGIIAVDIRDYS